MPGTVVAARYTFLDNNPEAFVFATGSTPAKTRLYRMGITKFYNEIENDFYLFGQINEKWYVFEIRKEYDGFLVRRKFALLAVMKTEVEKKIEALNKRKVPIVTIDPSLNKYQGKVLFPEKLALAEEKLKGAKLPELKSAPANVANLQPIFCQYSC